MIMELLIMSVSMMIMVQNSTLWMSALLVPLSILLMVSLNNFYWVGGMTAYVFVMIFVGGLLILLVLVTSTSAQEESSLLNSIFIVAILSYFLIEVNPFSEVEVNLLSEGLVSFIFNQTYILYMLVMVVIALAAISLFFLKFKGLMRSI